MASPAAAATSASAPQHVGTTGVCRAAALDLDGATVLGDGRPTELPSSPVLAPASMTARAAVYLGAACRAQPRRPTAPLDVGVREEPNTVARGPVHRQVERRVGIDEPGRP